MCPCPSASRHKIEFAANAVIASDVKIVARNPLKRCGSAYCERVTPGNLPPDAVATIGQLITMSVRSTVNSPASSASRMAVSFVGEWSMDLTVVAEQAPSMDAKHNSENFLNMCTAAVSAQNHQRQPAVIGQESARILSSGFHFTDANGAAAAQSASAPRRTEMSGLEYT